MPTYFGNPLSLGGLQAALGGRPLYGGIPGDPQYDEMRRLKAEAARRQLAAFDPPPSALMAPPQSGMQGGVRNIDAMGPWGQMDAGAPPPQQQEGMLFNPLDDPRFQEGPNRQLMNNAIRVNELRGSSPDQTIFLNADVDNAQQIAAARGAPGAAVPTASFKGDRLLEALQRQVTGLNAAAERDYRQAAAEHYMSLADRNRMDVQAAQRLEDNADRIMNLNIARDQGNLATTMLEAATRTPYDVTDDAMALQQAQRIMAELEALKMVSDSPEEKEKIDQAQKKIEQKAKKAEEAAKSEPVLRGTRRFPGGARGLAPRQDDLLEQLRRGL